MVYCNSMQANALPMGLTQIITHLKLAGFEIDHFDTTFYWREDKSPSEFRMENLQFPPCEIRYQDGDIYEDFKARIESFSPDLTGMSMVEPTFLLREVKPDATSIFLFTPYKGNHMRKECEDRGMVSRDFIGGDYFQMGHILKNNSLSGDDALGLFRTIPLYVQMPESDYARIQRAEKYDDEGNAIYAELREEFYKIMGWKPIKPSS